MDLRKLRFFDFSLSVFIMILLLLCSPGRQVQAKTEETRQGRSLQQDEQARILEDYLPTRNIPSNVTIVSRDAYEQEINALAEVQPIKGRRLQSANIDESLTLYIEPGTGFRSMQVLGVFVRCNNNPDAKIYYEISYNGKVDDLTDSSPYITYNSPYLSVNTPFGEVPRRQVFFQAVYEDPITFVISKGPVYNATYWIEGGARPKSYFFLVPGVETEGNFVTGQMEMAAAARAQAAGGQEFADFSSYLGVGTYPGQLAHIHLPDLDPDLNGFEGGYAVNCSGLTVFKASWTSSSYGSSTSVLTVTSVLSGALAMGMNITNSSASIAATTQIIGAYGYLQSTFNATWSINSDTLLVSASTIRGDIIIGLELSAVTKIAFQPGTTIESVTQSGSTFTLKISSKTIEASASSTEVKGIFTGKGGPGLYLITVQSSSGNAMLKASGRYWGVLVPYHNGNKFFGKVLMMDLYRVAKDVDNCMKFVRKEWFNSNIVIQSSGASSTEACIFIFDLSTKNPRAVGFKRGIVGYPYVYLSPGEYNVAVRIDMENIGLVTTKFVDLAEASPTYGGFSGGFEDRGWACFNPLRTFEGPVGGLRSSLLVDKHQLRPYYHGMVLCVGPQAWNGSVNLADGILVFDLGTINPDLRGFSDAIRVGRYAYFVPIQSNTNTYTSKLIRLYLGINNIYDQITTLINGGGVIKDISTILDLSQANVALKGFSGVWYSGQYLFLSPYRNTFEPKMGSRGHGFLAKIDMNNFQVSGIKYLDLTSFTRNQIPSMPEVDFRGFCCGFASGRYGTLVPFYSGYFNGKIARLQTTPNLLSTSLDTEFTDLQELDLENDDDNPKLFKGFRGAMPSLWSAIG